MRFLKIFLPEEHIFNEENLEKTDEKNKNVIPPWGELTFSPSLLLNTYSSSSPNLNTIAKILLDKILLDKILLDKILLDRQQQTGEKLNLYSRPWLFLKDCSRRSAMSKDTYVFKAIHQYCQIAL